MVIQTKYAGYRFRSRTEARWAVFFDKIGLPYRYEHEGYELASGVWYLPDFYLPTLDCYIEIKGAYPKPDELERARLMGKIKPTAVFYDLPGYNPGFIWLFDGDQEVLHEVDLAFGLFEGWALTTWDELGNEAHGIKSGYDDLFVPMNTQGRDAIEAALSADF